MTEIDHFPIGWRIAAADLGKHTRSARRATIYRLITNLAAGGTRRSIVVTGSETAARGEKREERPQRDGATVPSSGAVRDYLADGIAGL